MAEKVKIEGLKQLTSSLHKFEGDVRKSTPKINKKASVLVATTAKGKAPRLSGRLAGSIRPGGAGDVVYVQSTLIYAGVQEFGGYHGITAHKYLSGALAQDTPAIIALHERELDANAKKIRGM